MSSTSESDRLRTVIASCTCVTDTVATSRGDVVVVTVSGEIDMNSTAGLERILRAVVARRPSHVIVDLEEVRFCDARGLRVLTASLPVVASAAGVGYALSAVPTTLAYLMACLIGGGPNDPRQSAGLDDALAAVLDPDDTWDAEATAEIDRVRVALETQRRSRLDGGGDTG